MKLTQTIPTKKIIKSCLLKLFLIDLLLLILFRYYQPLCEPCLDALDCPPCLSKQQYFIIYFGLGANLILGFYCFYKHRNKTGRNHIWKR